MESSNGVGLMAVIAVSGSVAYVAAQAHKRLMTEFMKKVEFEFGAEKDMERDLPKKKVRFADDVIDPSSNKKEYYRMKNPKNRSNVDHLHNAKLGIETVNRENRIREMEGSMPLNRLALYKGMIEYRSLRGHVVSY